MVLVLCGLVMAMRVEAPPQTHSVHHSSSHGFKGIVPSSFFLAGSGRSLMVSTAGGRLSDEELDILLEES